MTIILVRKHLPSFVCLIMEFLPNYFLNDKALQGRIELLHNTSSLRIIVLLFKKILYWMNRVDLQGVQEEGQTDLWSSCVLN